LWSFRQTRQTCQIFKKFKSVLGFGFILIFLPIKNRDFFRNFQNVHISVVRFQKKIFFQVFGTDPGVARFEILKYKILDLHISVILNFN
jgi:hypothetical protein